MSGVAFNLAVALDAVAGDEQLLAMVLQVFVDTAPPLWQDLLQQGEATPAADIAAMAHRLKGGAASVAAERLADVCMQIELLTRSGDAESWPALLPSLRTEAQAALDAVTAYLHKH